MTRALATIAAVMLLGATALASAPLKAQANTRHCANVHTHYIDARAITVAGGLRCTRARALLRSLFARVVRTAQTEGGCAQQRNQPRGCEYHGYSCIVRFSGRIGLRAIPIT